MTNLSVPPTRPEAWLDTPITIPKTLSLSRNLVRPLTTTPNESGETYALSLWNGCMPASAHANQMVARRQYCRQCGMPVAVQMWRRCGQLVCHLATVGKHQNSNRGTTGGVPQGIRHATCLLHGHPFATRSFCCSGTSCGTGLLDARRTSQADTVLYSSRG